MQINWMKFGKSVTPVSSVTTATSCPVSHSFSNLSLKCKLIIGCNCVRHYSQFLSHLGIPLWIASPLTPFPGWTFTRGKKWKTLLGMWPKTASNGSRTATFPVTTLATSSKCPTEANAPKSARRPKDATHFGPATAGVRWKQSHRGTIEPISAAAFAALFQRSFDFFYLSTPIFWKNPHSQILQTCCFLILVIFFPPPFFIALNFEFPILNQNQKYND